ncbi:S8 family serine peptidase [Photobacterium sp. 1_MG-2023]|uniref:S8 family serine peptidase n=1 Tax=Photobacterium sp. 1_MG-2023 TaxID=3062646 RepID=UPI0026E30DED|nr:S8 family serine peptidase [Photobacterium sp. 1_MG-2023]MDO6707678.1 S8 family serine peptidase [Photobacterium sp. 1_MG-2023]
MKTALRLLPVMVTAALLPTVVHSVTLPKPAPVLNADVDWSWVPDEIPSDPLYSQQWHLQNHGQTAFSRSGGLVGQDMNLYISHAIGVRGQGVTIAVVDDGLEIGHPDLAANIRPGSRDVVNNDDDPTPDDPTDGHGTAVAGIAAAVGWNGVGGRGVAPYAGLKGFNWLNNQSMEAWLLSHGEAENTADVRVFNQSYGSSSIVPRKYDLNQLNTALKEQAYERVSRESHQGLGSLFVKSAGNSYKRFRISLGSLGRTLILPGDYYDTARIGPANNGLPMQDSNITSDNANFWNMVVSALNANGELSSYSSVGANVFVSAPGGEYGTDSPAMITTDVSGCHAGYNTVDRLTNGLHGGTALDPRCEYNGVMNGTSSAAPNASGAVAMIMSANPNLSWRDVKHILASTATKTDPNHSGVHLTFTGSNQAEVTYAAIPGWQTNAAGYDFHNFYGFGRVNVDGAVAMAQTYSAPLPPMTITPWQHVNRRENIPDANLHGAVSTYQQANDFVVEAVQVKVDIDHERVHDLAIELVSPSGTRSVILSPRSGLVGQSVYSNVNGFEQQLLLSNHFYGESAQGQWQLVVRDTNQATSQWIAEPQNGQRIPVSQQNNAQDGVLKSWDIRFFGHQG